MNSHVISQIVPGSIADELELEPGDVLLSINDKPIEDVFDYHYLTNDEYLVLVIRKADGEEWELEIEKDLEEDLGITFENSLMDEYRSCRNKCIFCFIDQMPPGMRETLYFKDDDSRLSFLQGNYVTLTNMSDHDIDRIIYYHLGPINISFHTTNPRLRCQMLHNRFAGDVFDKIRRLADAGIELNGQIVLCKNVNDGEELERSLGDFETYMPALRSVSIVPVGLTKFREGLYPLESFDSEDAKAVIDRVERWQQYYRKKTGMHMVHCSDEWYLLAGRELPEAERYDGYLQLENGVGMLRLLGEELQEALKDKKTDIEPETVTIATGCLAAPYIKKLAEMIMNVYPQINIRVVPVKNEFFGEMITVSGLVTGQDLIKQLKTKELGDRLIIPCNMLRAGENVFLDDRTVEEAEKELNISIAVADSGGDDLLKTILYKKEVEIHKRRQLYEQTDSSNCRPS